MQLGGWKGSVSWLGVGHVASAVRRNKGRINDIALGGIRCNGHRTQGLGRGAVASSWFKLSFVSSPTNAIVSIREVKKITF